MIYNLRVFKGLESKPHKVFKYVYPYILFMVRTKVQEIGKSRKRGILGSIAVIIPRSIAELKHIHKGDTVDIVESNALDLIIKKVHMCAGCGKNEVERFGDICIYCEKEADGQIEGKKEWKDRQ